MSLFSPQNEFSFYSTQADQIYSSASNFERMEDYSEKGFFENPYQDFDSLEKIQRNAKSIIYDVTHKKEIVGANGKIVSDKVLSAELNTIGCALSRIAQKVFWRAYLVESSFKSKPRSAAENARYERIEQSFAVAEANLNKLYKQLETLSEVIQERFNSSSVQDQSIELISKIQKNANLSKKERLDLQMETTEFKESKSLLTKRKTLPTKKIE